MLNLKSLNLSGIISGAIVLLLCTGGYSQDLRMDRLALQYQLFRAENADENFRLKLEVANQFLAEGNYEKALGLIDQVKEDNHYKDEKNLIKAKAEFLNDNYEGSLSFLRIIDPMQLTKSLFWDFELYRVLNYNHLLQKDSAYLVLLPHFLKAKLDTVTVYEQIIKRPLPNFHQLKKARNLSAIFPGAGLLYVGEKKKAFTSTFLSLTFLAYAAYSVYTQYYITAVLTGGSQFLRFYHGGKRSSVKIADKKNRERYLDYVIELDTYCEKKIFEISEIIN
jgi:hypothetical protein